ncbi:MAG TPA: 50S ribosomal protein L23 [Atopostipes sp.]|nr:50S ribosomal protein L23 [Atopostipes sp.]
MDAREVILRPVITEQSVYDMDEKKYTFIVDPRANKTHVKHAIEEIFDVDVKKVNIQNTARKPKTMGNMRQYRGFKKSRKKAIVTLTEASAEIDLFGENNDE